MTGVARLRTAVSVRVVGRIAHVSVEEWFENRGTRVAEGDYLYPLTGEAVFSNFTLYQEALRGETMDAAQARSIYEAIVRKRRALYVRDGPTPLPLPPSARDLGPLSPPVADSPSGRSARTDRRLSGTGPGTRQ